MYNNCSPPGSIVDIVRAHTGVGSCLTTAAVEAGAAGMPEPDPGVVEPLSHVNQLFTYTM